MKGIFLVNGGKYEFEFAGSETLLDLLRREGFTEIKKGCGEGHCGACAVIVGDKLKLACQSLAASAMNTEIITTKGLGDMHNPHPIQEAFVKTGAVQCGFCIPGKVIATYALLKRNPDPTDDEIKEGLDGHICRCTGYVKTLEGVKLAAKMMREAE